MTEGTESTQANTRRTDAVIHEASGASAAGATDAVTGTQGGGGGPAGPSGINKYGVVFAVIVLIALLLGLWFWRAVPSDSGAEKFPIAWFIIIAAILGAAVNEPFRQSEDHRPTYTWIAAYIFWKSAVSVVFAFLLYLMAIGGLIGGDLFPQFVETPLGQGVPWNMEAFVTKVDPKSYKDIAKILVWSFIAGYSEKFVPNLIGKLLRASEDQGKGGV